MITIFNRKAIYIGYSKEERNRIVKLLAENKIPYDENIYVKASDYEECEFLIRQM